MCDKEKNIAEKLGGPARRTRTYHFLDLMIIPVYYMRIVICSNMKIAA